MAFIKDQTLIQHFYDLQIMCEKTKGNSKDTISVVIINVVSGFEHGLF